MPTEQITLAPGKSGQVSFEVIPEEARTYLISVNGLTGNFEAIALPANLQIERFFLVTAPVAEHGEFEAHCHVRNIGGSTAIGRLNLIGEISVAWLTMEINETQEFTLGPGEVHKYTYRYSTYKGDKGWLKVVGEWGEETPPLEFEAGYYGYDLSLVATEIGVDYAILRYTRDEMCDTWDFGLETAEQTINFPDLRILGGWPTVYHLMTGLLSGRTYNAWCRGRNGGVKTGRTEFTTR